MSDVTVRALGPEDWQAYRELRLRALAEAPTAFTNTTEQEQGFDEALWRARMTRSTRLLASADDTAEGGAAVGIVSVGQAEPDVAELFGMWVVPSSRGAGVAWRLMEAATEHARVQGRRALQAWVSTDNGRAVAFFSSYGFRPSDQRRPMTNDASLQELAMVLPIGDDSGWVPVVR
ncbi:MAG: GNAT family N-acetyltransferase [Rhodoferax sp.]|nr:GNAT family N-acetyltransferase [Actinomycetota bacterium]